MVTQQDSFEIKMCMGKPRQKSNPFPLKSPGLIVTISFRSVQLLRSFSCANCSKLLLSHVKSDSSRCLLAFCIHSWAGTGHMCRVCPQLLCGSQEQLSPCGCSTCADVPVFFPAATFPSRHPAAPGAPGCQQQERGHRARRHRGGSVRGSCDRSLWICR